MSFSMISGNIQAMGVLGVSVSGLASVAANTSAERAITVPGVRVGDYVDVTTPSITAGLDVSQARVSASDTVQLLFQNSTAGGLSPPAGVYQILVIRPGGLPAPTGFAP